MRYRIRTVLMSMAVMAAAVVGAGLANTPASATAAAPIVEEKSGFTLEPANVGAQSGYVRNSATNRCLEQAVGGAVGHVFTAPCHYGQSQTWTWIGTADYRPLRNLWSQECLDGTQATGRIYTLSCNGGNYQAWYFTPRSEIAQRQSQQCLDSNWEGSVYLSPCNQGNYQKWY
ncbi:RICIN domain-containing protein [Nonomuraea sp. NPDC049709]|uniref:RICIN domain-containing protein n=1 Tax=Nonomuraea sp. NPDC049709 TaxID=3154736 RepID=UPI00343502BA